MKRLPLLLFAITFLIFQPVKAQQVVSEKYSQQHTEVYFTFTFTGRQQLQTLGRFISIDKVRHDTVYAYANTTGFNRFLKKDIPYRILTTPSERWSRQQLLPKKFKSTHKWDFYPSYEQYVTLMQSFQKNYPHLCQIVNIGHSVDGRDLLFAHIGHLRAASDTVPEFMYTSTMHGDETTGYILMLHLIDYLLSNYGIKPEITHLIDSLDIWINPLANPDGTYAAGNASVYGATRFNANGVDLNRNYPDPRAGQHPDGNSWQPETIAFMHFARKHHFVLSCNLHTGSEVANYPWDTWAVRTADDAWWQEVCRQYADTVHAHSRAGYFTELNNGITDGYDWYSITGGRQDYMNYFQYDREFTLELSDTKMPLPDSLPKYWEYNYRSLLNYMHQALEGLRGTVTDSLTGKPLKVEIFVLHHDTLHSQVYSDSITGRYFRPIYPGTYSFRFSAAGYHSKIIRNLRILQGKPVVLPVALSPEKTNSIKKQNIRKALFYPNPAFDKIYCTGFSQQAIVSVINLSGETVLKEKIKKEETLNISALKPGVYLLKITTGKQTFSGKFVKK